MQVTYFKMLSFLPPSLSLLKTLFLGLKIHSEQLCTHRNSACSNKQWRIMKDE